MQDISRNELLDKLAAGWKVRRKCWNKVHPYFLTLKDNEGIPPQALIADDWEGEPPGPVCLWEGRSVDVAFRYLKDGAAFIRRSAWQSHKKVYYSGDHVNLAIVDILCSDWEVWG